MSWFYFFGESRNGCGIWRQNCNKISHLTILLRYSPPPLWSQDLFLCWAHPASHLSTKPGTSASPKVDFSPQATTNHLSTIKALQTTKITKLNFLSLSQTFSHWFLAEGSPYKNRKRNRYSPTPWENIRLFMIWFFDLLPIRPLMYTHSSSPKTLYPLYQVPIEKPCSHVTSPIHCNIILSLGSNSHSLEQHQLSRRLKPHHAYKNSRTTI